MESLRMLQWRQLCEAEEALKAAHRNAEKSADLYIWFWLLAGMQVADKASGPEDFDCQMRQTSSMLQSGEVSMLCRLLGITATQLLENVREALARLSFPFAVQAYHSKQHERCIILTIPNPDSEE